MRVSWRVSPTVVMVLALGAPRLVLGQGLKLFGYVDVEANVAGVGSDDAEVFFDAHHFNLIAIGSLVDHLLAAAEVEFEHAGEEIALEYGERHHFGRQVHRALRSLQQGSAPGVDQQGARPTVRVQ